MKKYLAIAFLLSGLSLPATAQETRIFTDSAGREVTIPASPQRIVALHDTSITLPLVELGKPPVGSLGRVRPDGSRYLRAVETILHTSFENSDIDFVGQWAQFDLEAIAALQPDLIIGLSGCQDDIYDQLAAITATVYVPCRPEDALEKIRMIAGAAGIVDRYETRIGAYRDAIEQAKDFIPEAGEITVSHIQAQGYDGKVHVYADYGALTTVLDDIGFARPAPVDAMRANGTDEEIISPEVIERYDGDFVIDTFRIDQDDSPANMLSRWAEMVPGYCVALHACREGQFIALPREHASPQSFTTLQYNINYVVTHIAGRDFAPMDAE
ncbi:iron complex transport system substrate-binding protein [Roseivivax halotolerans]|uniref:Iron complex transport system substrate-binding protein n=1 Tax=Roseivivax halotolerans TaxID=93684 RepID=A0A1I6A684_9RHOB|nr:ABC transporter substrate-binding protein [Roseivivax halotolerans]SFQ64241.1 iron complex transport system substrate-binding protein [Roseivivax halotolerans]